MKLSFELRSEINSGRECSGFPGDKNGTEEVGVFTDGPDKKMIENVRGKEITAFKRINK